MGTGNEHHHDDEPSGQQLSRRLAQIRAGVGEGGIGRGVRLALALVVVTAVLVLTWLLTLAADVGVVIRTEQTVPGDINATVVSEPPGPQGEAHPLVTGQEGGR